MKRVLWVLLACGLFQWSARADEATHQTIFDTVPPDNWTYLCIKKIETINPDTGEQIKGAQSFVRPITRYEIAVVLARIEDRHHFETSYNDAASEDAAWASTSWPELKNLDCSAATIRDIMVALHREFGFEMRRLDGGSYYPGDYPKVTPPLRFPRLQSAPPVTGETTK